MIDTPRTGTWSTEDDVPSKPKHMRDKGYLQHAKEGIEFQKLVRNRDNRVNDVLDKLAQDAGITRHAL